VREEILIEHSQVGSFIDESAEEDETSLIKNRMEYIKRFNELEE
jgi:hypothetical protein